MADEPVHAAAVDRPGRHWPLRMMSAVVLVVLGGAVVASCVTTQNVIRHQERLILQERTGEAAAVLGSAFASVQDSLQLLGRIAGQALVTGSCSPARRGRSSDLARTCWSPPSGGPACG